jgi:hypothetical protein
MIVYLNRPDRDAALRQVVEAWPSDELDNLETAARAAITSPLGDAPAAELEEFIAHVLDDPWGR